MQYLILLTGLTMASASLATDLDIPHKFTAGTPAIANEVNANFEATKTAINNKQDQLSSADCSVGKVVQSIAADGSTTCVDLTTPKTRYLALPGEAFVSATGQSINTSSDSGGAYHANINSSDTLVAAIHLPDGAVITEFAVWMEDAAPGQLDVSLNRRSLSNTGINSIANLSSVGVYSAGVRTYLSSPLSETVDNATSAYLVRAVSSTWPGNAALRITGARVTYTH